MTEQLKLTVENLSKYVAESLLDHELRDPDYTPSEQERFIANDFAQGLIADPEFLRLVWHHYNELILYRIDAGHCVDCGYPGESHFGSCGTTRSAK